MGTKKDPGKFDCYDLLDPDEPYFLLMGRDPFAPKLVDVWAELYEDAGGDPDKAHEARVCAEEMRTELVKRGRIDADADMLLLGKPLDINELKGRSNEEQSD